MAIDALRHNATHSEVITGVRYLDEETILTTAGITAGIYAALYLENKQLGNDLRTTIAKVFEYEMR